MTILYIMKHNKTGKKYFGKSQKTFQEFKKYYGSGSYWTNHLKKHGRDITTRIYAIYDETDPYYKDILVSVALRFSEENDIVNSKEWAIRMGEVQRSKPRVECPHCGKVGAPNNMKRYHLDNCKFKPES